MPRYRIEHGGVRVSLPEGEKVLAAGDELELEEADAARLGDQVLLLPAATPAPAKPGKGKPGSEG